MIRRIYISLLPVLVLFIAACAQTLIIPKGELSSYKTDNDGLVNGKTERGQYNTEPTAISGRIGTVQYGPANKILYELVLDHSEQYSIWIVGFWGPNMNWLKSGYSVKVLGVVGDVRANMSIWSITKSDYLMTGFCLIDMDSGRTSFVSSECTDWLDGEYKENKSLLYRLDVT